MTLAYIGLGANINDPVRQIMGALEALDQLPQTRLVKHSGLYTNAPMGPQDQPDYVNAVAAIETGLTPIELLDALKNQEQTQGRVKLRHWGERTIDLDILLYGDLTMTSERLNIPHKDMHRRTFVIRPLLDIAPELCLPDGTRIADLTPDYGGELFPVGDNAVDI